MPININGITNNEQEIKSILEKIQKQTEENNKLLKKINFHFNLQRVWGLIKVLIIVVPIILAYIYIPRWLEQYKADPGMLLKNPWLETYIQGLTEQMSKNIDPSKVDLNKIDTKQLEQYKKLITK